MITKTSEAWDTFQKISLKYRDPWDTFQKIREIRLDEALPDWGYVSKDATTTEREPQLPVQFIKQGPQDCGRRVGTRHMQASEKEKT